MGPLVLELCSHLLLYAGFCLVTWQVLQSQGVELVLSCTFLFPPQAGLIAGWRCSQRPSFPANATDPDTSPWGGEAVLAAHFLATCLHVGGIGLLRYSYSTRPRASFPQGPVTPPEEMCLMLAGMSGHVFYVESKSCLSVRRACFASVCVLGLGGAPPQPA